MIIQVNITHQFGFPIRKKCIAEIRKLCTCANKIITILPFWFCGCNSIPLIQIPYRLKCHIFSRHGIACTAGICSGSVTPAFEIHAVYLKSIIWKRNYSSGCGIFQCRRISLEILASRRKGNFILRCNRKIHLDSFYRIIPGFITQTNRSCDTSVYSRFCSVCCLLFLEIRRFRPCCLNFFICDNVPYNLQNFIRCRLICHCLRLQRFLCRFFDIH